MTYREPISESNDMKQPTSPRRRSRRTAEQSREQILRAATVEFATHGLAGGRISRIVQKAGTNPRMIYEHFGSKSALYVATLENALAALRAEELTLDVEHLDPLEGLLQLFRFHERPFRARRPSRQSPPDRESDEGPLHEEVIPYSRDVVS